MKNAISHEPDELKSLLKAKGISIRDIAESLSISHPVVSEIINQKYNGAQSTKEKVMERIHQMLQSKADLNTIIYSDAKLYVKILGIAIKHKSFNDDETMKLIETKKILEAFINNQ